MSEELCKPRVAGRAHLLRLGNNLSKWAQQQEVAWSLSEWPGRVHHVLRMRRQSDMTEITFGF